LALFALKWSVAPVQWLKHAFAVEQPGPAEPTDTQRAAVERVCLEIVRRRLTTPALFGLEMIRPLNYLGSQALHFFAPVISVFAHSDGHREFARFLEHRGSIEYICGRIETLETEAASRKSQHAQPPEAGTDE
jgi:hypothetical protein